MDTLSHLINWKCNISFSTKPISSKLGCLVTFREKTQSCRHGPPIRCSRNITWHMDLQYIFLCNTSRNRTWQAGELCCGKPTHMRNPQTWQCDNIWWRSPIQPFVFWCLKFPMCRWCAKRLQCAISYLQYAARFEVFCNLDHNTDIKKWYFFCKMLPTLNNYWIPRWAMQCKLLIARQTLHACACST